MCAWGCVLNCAEIKNVAVTPTPVAPAIYQPSPLKRQRRTDGVTQSTMDSTAQSRLIVKNAQRRTDTRNGALLRRETFTTSRLLDYFSEKELALQTGHDREQWPEVALKELVDNALDAAEDSGITPDVSVTVEDNTLAVADNGPGIAPDVVARILDFSTKTSSKDFYISPTRGAQGNALKTLLAMPYVLSDGAGGQLEICSQGVRHVITVAVDRIRQEPKISHDQKPCDVKSGSVVKIHWPELAGSDGQGRGGSFLQQVSAYALLNPHATFHFRDGTTYASPPATAPGWQKWRPNDPTSAHWYSVEQFCSLIAAYLAAEPGDGATRFVRDFVKEFRSLSGTAKQKRVLGETGLAGARLSALVRNGEVDRDLASKLLTAMQRHSREVKPQALGVIGEQHIRQKLEADGCHAQSIRYKRVAGVDDARRPYIVETAFGVFEDSDAGRELLCGLNFSPCILNPFRKLSSYESLDGVLGEQFLYDESKTFVLVHLAAPYLQYADRGKSTVEVPSCIGTDIKNAVLSVTKDWAKIKKREFRNKEAGERAMERMLKAYNPKSSIVGIVRENMAEVYAKVSGDNTLPAGARQLMYAMRSIVLAELSDENFNDQYFTNNMLPEYLHQHPEETADWDVVFDARGHLLEPHTEREIPLGTLAVREYLDGFIDAPADLDEEPAAVKTGYDTVGPANRFLNVLFIEKEGFLPLLVATRIAKRFDLAIMSTKGMSSTAARTLMERMEGVRFLVLHDFDKAGFSILGTLRRDTWRYQFKHPPEVIDLGLRLADVKAERLPGEPVTLRGRAPEENLRLNGATDAEIAYLTGDGSGNGQRVELNAMTSPQFIKWVERKLLQHGVTKMIPNQNVLALAYRSACLAHRVNKEMKRQFEAMRKEVERVAVPKDLARRVKCNLKQDPQMSWDAVVSDIASKA